MMHGKEVPVRDGEQSATLSNAIFAIPSLKSLKFSTLPAYKQFDSYLNILRDLRNTESHGSIKISENEIDAALRIVVDMYLFVTATNITELEMAGHYADIAQPASLIPIRTESNKINSLAE